MAKIVIIGAGLAGLSAGYHLGGEDYVIFEKEERPGGLCRSDVIDGFVFDRAIHVLYTKDPYAEHLIKEELLKDNLLIHKRESWIYSYGVYTEYPFQANTYGLPPEVVRDCVLGFIEAKFAQREGQEPSNFLEWIYATFGRGIAEHFMIPYNRRLWAYPLEEMSFDWIAERVPSPKIEDVINGALLPPEKKYGPNAVFWYPERGGMEALVRALYERVDKGKVKLGAEVVRVDIEHRFVELQDGRREYFEKLISTLPLPRLIQLMDAPEDVRETVSTLAYNTIYAVNFGLAREGVGGNFHWLYLPEDNFVFHRVSFPHNLSPFNAPEGMSALTCEVSSSPYKMVDEGAILEQCIEGLKTLGFITGEDEVVASSVEKLSPAYVIYTKGHREVKAKVKAFLEANGVYTCGRFGEWEYFNMDHSILSGKRAVEKAMEGERIDKVSI